MPTKHDLVEALYVGKHIGPKRGITARHLTARLNCAERRVRELISEAREDGTAICGHPRTGYFIADTPQDVETYYISFLVGRAMHSLRLASIASKRPLRELAGQLFLNA